MWSHERSNVCVPMPKEFLAFSDPLVITLLTLMLLGLVNIPVVALILYLCRKRHNVENSNPQIIGLLLVSLWGCIASNLLYVGPPSDLICKLRDTTNIVFLTLTIGSVLTLTLQMFQGKCKKKLCHYLTSSFNLLLLLLFTITFLMIKCCSKLSQNHFLSRTTSIYLNFFFHFTLHSGSWKTLHKHHLQY